MLRLAAALLGVVLLACLVRRTRVDIVVQHTKTVGLGMAVIIAIGGISYLIRGNGNPFVEYAAAVVSPLQWTNWAPTDSI
jgi:hypothetical protein